MSTALVSSFHNLEDIISPNRRFLPGRTPLAGERRMMGTPITGANRNNKQVPVVPHSTGAYLQSGKLAASVPTSPTTAQLISAAMSHEGPRFIGQQPVDTSKHQIQNMMGTADNNMEVFSISGSDVTPRRKFDRSISEPAPEKHVNSSRYKTELCRPFEENGFCKYGEKCQFAHGILEMRSLSRHPKYKTELCRTFHTVGFCPYGPRCHFIHNEEERKLNVIVQQQAAQQKLGQQQAAPAQQQVLPPMAGARKPIPQSLAINMNFKMDRDTLGSTADSPPSSVTDSPSALSPVFGQGHGMDDLFNGISAAFTPPPASAPPAYAGVAFTFPDFNAMKTAQNPSMAVPLTIHTDQATGTLMSSLNTMHLSHSAKSTAMLNQQRNNNLNNLLNESLFQEKKALTKATLVCPPSPPDSVEEDIPQAQGVHAPVDATLDPKGLRLPIFSRLASEDE